MKKWVIFFFTLTSFSAIAQVGIGTSTPNVNSALEISATNNKGLLIPRGDAATRTALNGNTAKGLMLYDTSTNSLWIHDGNGLPSGWHNQQPVANRSIIPYSFSNMTPTTGPEGSPSNLWILPNMVLSYSTSIPGQLFGITAFPLPKNGTITSLALYYNVNNSATYSSPPVITAQIYIADATPGGANVFTPFAGAQTSIVFPTTVSAGAFGANMTNLSVPVTALQRVVVALYLSGPPGVTVSGNVNAAIVIE
jgi:hypothetical protein